ncbi:MAG TPA: hypothetical protein VHM31_24770 [Polyangia bacterium]|nr:hypothetical protein [Polyangia bacterium]
MLWALARSGRFGALLALFVFAGRAVAQDPPRVQVVVAAAPAVAATVAGAVRDSLARKALAVDAAEVARVDPSQLVRPPDARTPVALVARVWLDLVSAQPTMYFVTEPSGLVYVRPLAVHAAPDAVELELIRFVVGGAVQAILEGQPLGVTRAEFARSLAAPAAAAGAMPPMRPATTVVSPRWAIAAEYAGARLSSGVVAHGPALVAMRLWPRLQLGVVLLQRFPVTLNSPAAGTTNPAVSASLTTSGVRLFAALPARLTPRLWASAGLGAGIDVTHVEPGGRGATSAFWVTDPLVLAAASVQRAFGRLLAGVDAGVELDLIAPRYSALRPGQSVTVWTPARWRPFAGARLGVLF